MRGLKLEGISGTYGAFCLALVSACASSAPHPEPSLGPGEPLTPAMNAERWDGLFGRYERARDVLLGAEEERVILDALASIGVPEGSVAFVGANVFVDDVMFSAEPLLERHRSEVVSKGKVLAQAVTQVLGNHDPSLVSPTEVIGAPVQYASQPLNDTFLFRRPEVDPSFDHVLVLGDDVPEAIVEAFRASVAEIGNASDADCLSPTFLQVLTRGAFDAAFPRDPFAVPPRVIEVVYSPDVCPNALGCTQYPHTENVVLAAPTPEGGLGTVQNRMVLGSFIGINSAFITPESEEFSTITHELMHALGVTHPVTETFPSGAVAAKLVVPGTAPGDGGFPSIMAFRTSGDRVFNLSADDVDTIATLYSAAPGCAYSSEPIVIEAN